MDRYLLLVICREGKVSSAVGGEAEHLPGASVEDTEKQPGKCWAGKAGTACGEEKKFEFVN